MNINIGPYSFKHIHYDRTADVLYLAREDPAHAVDFEETPDGHAVSYDRAGQLLGLTLVDVHRLLNDAQGETLVIELPARAASASLEQAVA